MAGKQTLAQRALAELLAFYGQLDAPAKAGELGAAIDATLAQPTPPLEAPEGLDAALVTRGLRLPPR